MNIFNRYNNMFRLGNWCYNETGEPYLFKLENYDDVVLSNTKDNYKPLCVAEACLLGFFDSWEKESSKYTFSCNDCTISVIHRPIDFCILIETPLGHLEKKVMFLNDVQNLWYFMTGYELYISPKYNHLSEVPIVSDYIKGMPRPKE